MKPGIEPLTDRWLDEAARVHSASWKESHRAFCSEDFVEAHTPQRQKAYLLDEMRQGKRFFVLVENGACLGLVSEWDGWIENLYVDPKHVRKGIGSKLLAHVCALNAVSRLFVLSNNARAIAFYEKAGFRFTGKEKALNDWLSEREMIR